MMRFIKKTREFIMEEKDVTTVIGVVNEHRRHFDYTVGSCGWADDPTKWFVMFDATDKKYGVIVKKLSEIGSFNVDVSPSGNVNLVFERVEP